MFTIFGIVSAWFAKVHEKGEITTDDAMELITSILGITGVNLNIKL
jgi:hypothetical protein